MLSDRDWVLIIASDNGDLKIDACVTAAYHSYHVRRAWFGDEDVTEEVKYMYLMGWVELSYDGVDGNKDNWKLKVVKT